MSYQYDPCFWYEFAREQHTALLHAVIQQRKYEQSGRSGVLSPLRMDVVTADYQHSPLQTQSKKGDT